jgi:hypothetical protein
MDYNAGGARFVATNTGTNSSSMTFVIDHAGLYVTAIMISHNGHIHVKSATGPTTSAGTLSGNDNAGAVSGLTTAGPVTVTFGSVWGGGQPMCVVTAAAGTQAVEISSLTSTVLTVNTSPTLGATMPNTFFYICLGI